MAKKVRLIRIFLQLKSKILYFYNKIDFILLFFIALLFITFSSFFSFKSPVKSVISDKNEEIATLEIHNFKLNRFNNQTIDLNIIGSSIKQFKDKEIYTNFNGEKIDEKGEIEHLEGKNVVHINDDYDFIDGIFYTKTPHIKFFSQKGVYNTRDEIFRGSGDFIIEDSGMKTTGKNIFYDKKNDVIEASGIHSQIIKEDSKK